MIDATTKGSVLMGFGLLTSQPLTIQEFFIRRRGAFHSEHPFALMFGNVLDMHVACRQEI